jgi:hypothetical protein
MSRLEGECRLSRCPLHLRLPVSTVRSTALTPCLTGVCVRAARAHAARVKARNDAEQSKHNRVQIEGAIRGPARFA